MGAHLSDFPVSSELEKLVAYVFACCDILVKVIFYVFKI